MMPNEPGSQTLALYERYLRGISQEFITFTPQVLDDGHAEVLFWKYPDSDVKDDTSDHWNILVNNIISIFILMVTTLISLLSQIWIIQACSFILVYFKGSSDPTTPYLLLNVKKTLVSNGHFKHIIQEQNMETMPLCLQSSTRPLMSNLKKIFK